MLSLPETGGEWRIEKECPTRTGQLRERRGRKGDENLKVRVLPCLLTVVKSKKKDHINVISSQVAEGISWKRTYWT